MRPRRLFLALAAAATLVCISQGCGTKNHGSTGFEEPDAGDASMPPTGPSDANFALGADALALLDSGCATASAKVLRDPIYMLIVLDGSGSMAQDQKWNAVVPALKEFINDLEMQGDRSFGFGLTVFSDTNDLTQGKGPYPVMDIPVAYVDGAHAAALRGRLDGAKPMYETPTLAVMSGQYPLLESFTPPPPLLPGGKKVMVFMTDGVPYPDMDMQRPACVALAASEFAKTAPEGPITTFAVGIGHFFPYDPLLYDVQFIGALAKAGGAPNAGCYPDETHYTSMMCHMQVTPTGGQSSFELEQEFLIAFDKIRARVGTCDLTLDKLDGGLVDPTRVNVVFTDALGNTKLFYEEGTDGWSYDDPLNPTKVTLHGKACEQLKANPRGRIQVVLGCTTLVK